MSILNLFKIFLYFLLLIKISKNNSISINKVELKIIKNFPNSIIGVLTYMFKEKPVFLRYEHCKISLYLKMCQKYDFDKKYSNAFQCEYEAIETSDLYMEIQSKLKMLV